MSGSPDVNVVSNFLSLSTILSVGIVWLHAALMAGNAILFSASPTYSTSKLFNCILSNYNNNFL